MIFKTPKSASIKGSSIPKIFDLIIVRIHPSNINQPNRTIERPIAWYIRNLDGKKNPTGEIKENTTWNNSITNMIIFEIPSTLGKKVLFI